MQFTVGTVTRCAGTNHYQIPITLGSGRTGVIHTTLEEFRGDPPDSFEEARERVLDRIRSAAKEAGATTFPQFRAAVEKTFQV